MLLVHEASGSLACVAAGTMTRNEGPGHLPMLYKMFIVFLISIGFGESCSVGKHKKTPFQGSF